MKIDRGTLEDEELVDQTLSWLTKLCSHGGRHIVVVTKGSSPGSRFSGHDKNSVRQGTCRGRSL